MDIVKVLGESITDLCIEEKSGIDKSFDFDLDPRLCPSLSRLSWTFHTIDSPRVFEQLKKFGSLNNLTDFCLGLKQDWMRLYHSDRDANRNLVEKLDKDLAPVLNMPSFRTLTLEILDSPSLFYSPEWLRENAKTRSSMPMPKWINELESAKSGRLKMPKWFSP
ncbi:hypothetical protein K435DRAFT_974108 [Dendrothele bispora CBS 962.96]|uniref:Uncharacterized protein n=1 Tax=Dendrothele bispora (strain CBS 962.96) TaxID=1314807 RepID=A0A4S8KP80_DENBC|nr:hypothetical protein K435DRAFT_974108 [Dendrothele bispora CBS 962.96]